MEYLDERTLRTYAFNDGRLWAIMNPDLSYQIVKADILDSNHVVVYQTADYKMYQVDKYTWTHRLRAELMPKPNDFPTWMDLQDRAKNPVVLDCVFRKDGKDTVVVANMSDGTVEAITLFGMFTLSKKGIVGNTLHDVHLTFNP